MSDKPPIGVLVQVVSDGTDGREIGWGSNLPEQLETRLDDIRRAIEAGARAVALSLDIRHDTPDWRMQQVTASFGITLTAEAGVLVSKASAGATFEVSITFDRRNGHEPAGQGEHRDEHAGPD